MRRWLRSVVRSAMVVEIVVEGAVELLVRQPKTREERAAWLHSICARALRRLGIGVEVHGTFPAGGTLISNHLSYVDILVYASIHPCVFVSKIEVLELPVLGWMTKMAGTVYVRRGRGESALQAGEGIQQAVADGLPVVFFPEGTTNNGPDLLKFHAGLLGQVLETGESMTAAHVSYRLTKENGPEVSVQENVCWGDLPMFTHVFRLLGLRGIHAEVHFADGPIQFSSVNLHRKQAAVEAQAAVAALADGAAGCVSSL